MDRQHVHLTSFISISPMILPDILVTDAQYLLDVRDSILKKCSASNPCLKGTMHSRKSLIFDENVWSSKLGLKNNVPTSAAWFSS